MLFRLIKPSSFVATYKGIIINIIGWPIINLYWGLLIIGFITWKNGFTYHMFSNASNFLYVTMTHGSWMFMKQQVIPVGQQHSQLKALPSGFWWFTRFVITGYPQSSSLFLFGIFHYKPSILDTPMYGHPHMYIRTQSSISMDFFPYKPSMTGGTPPVMEPLWILWTEAL